MKELSFTNLEEKIAYYVDLNEEEVRQAGRNKAGVFSITTEDMEAAYQIFKSEADNEEIMIYPFDAYCACDNCYIITEFEEVSVDTDTGEQLCDDCLSDM